MLVHTVDNALLEALAPNRTPGNVEITKLALVGKRRNTTLVGDQQCCEASEQNNKRKTEILIVQFFNGS